MSSKHKRKNRNATPQISPPAPLTKKSPAPLAVSSEPRITLASSGRLPMVGFFLALLASIAWVFLHAYLVDSVTVRLCDFMDRDIPPENRMPVFLSEIAFDGYVWNRHAEHLGRDGNWRLRFTDFDNAPDGREVHWNSAFAWYLRGLGELHYSLTADEPGASLRNSIFRMSIWANPILLAIALLIFAPLTARRFGPLSGTVIAVGMVAIPTFYEGFMPAYPDHHGLISFFLLGMLFGIAWAGAGWVKGRAQGVFAPPATLEQARHGMIFSALCGAAGLWFSALSTSLVLGTLGVAAVVSTPFFLRSGRRAGLEFHPELWKNWALWGAGGSFFFYLLEYFPNHLGMRLEVNHPLYSLAFLGGGWAIYAVTKWFAADRKPPFPWRVLGLCAAACALLPAFILLGGAATYIPNDPFMARLWKNIAELLPLLTRIQLGGLTWSVAFGWFPVLLLAVAILQFVREVDTGTKAVLVFMAIPIILLTALQFYQVRWGLLVGPLYGALAAIVIPQIWRLVPGDSISRGAGALFLLAFAYLFVEPAFRNSFNAPIQQYRAKPGKIPLSPGQALALLHRQMARAILDHADGRPVVLLSSPNSSCMLSALGGFRTIGTLYWENVEGLKRASRALNAQSDEETRALFDKHGVTHVSMMTWENFIEPYFHILHPDAMSKPLDPPEERKSLEKSFGMRALFGKTIPDFTQPLVFPPNDLSRSLGQTILILKYAPDQHPDIARLQVARFALVVEDNPILAEITLRDLLDSPLVGHSAASDLASLYFKQKRDADGLRLLQQALTSPDPGLRNSAAAAALETAQNFGTLDAAQEIALLISNREDLDGEPLLASAWFFSTVPQTELRRPDKALSLLQRIDQSTLSKPDHYTLVSAAISAAAGDFSSARQLASEATTSQDPKVVAIAREMLASFELEKPWLPGAATPQNHQK